jgi:hypothetical protein
MLYGNSAALIQMHFSNGSVIANVSGSFFAHTYAPAPDRPLSMR